MLSLNMVLYLALGFFVLKLLLFLLTLWKFLSLRFKEEKIEIAFQDDIPENMRVIFSSADDTLAPLGFHYSHSVLVSEMLVSVHAKKWVQIYVNSEKNVYAHVVRSLFQDLGLPFDVVFVSIFSDGNRITTFNGLSSCLIVFAEDSLCVDPFASSLSSQWAAHCDAVSKESSRGRSLMLTPEDHSKNEQSFEGKGFDEAHQKGFLIRCSNGSSRFSFLQAIKKVGLLLKGEKKRKLIRRNILKVASPHPFPQTFLPDQPCLNSDNTLQIPPIRRHFDSKRQATNLVVASQLKSDAHVMSDLDAYHALEVAKKGNKMGSKTKAFLFFLSIVLFAVSFGITMSWETVSIILGVLFFHELGHLLGMHLFNYKDKQILFLPFLGAVTTGNALLTPSYQKVIIFLMGPIPGILLGYGCLWGSAHFQVSWLWEAGLMALIINYINLLPLLPLDGGRVLDILIFERWPRLQVFFLVLSACVAAIAALALPLLWFLFIVLVMTIPNQWRLGTIIKKLKTHELWQKQENGEEQLLLILDALQKPPYDKFNMHQKQPTVHELLQRINIKPAGILLIIGTMATVLSTFVVPLVVSVFINFPTDYSLSEESGNDYLAIENIQPDQLELRLSEAQTNDQKMLIVSEAIWSYQILGKKDDARSCGQRAVELARSFSHPDKRLADALVSYGGMVEEKEITRSLLEEALSIQEMLANYRAQDVILNNLASNAIREQNIEMAQNFLKRVLAIRAQDMEYDAYAISATHSRLGFSFINTNPEKAEQHFNSAFREVDNMEPWDPHEASSTVRELAEFYMSQALNKKAQTVLIGYLGNLGTLDDRWIESLRSEIHTLIGWSFAFDKDYRIALEYFERSSESRKKSKGWFRFFAHEDLSSLLDLGYVHYQLNNQDEAMRYFKQAEREVNKYGYDSIKECLEEVINMPDDYFGINNVWEKLHYENWMKVYQVYSEHAK